MLGLKIVKHLYIGHFSVKLLGLCKNHKIITATKQFIPMLGTLYSHVGNCHHQCLMLANQILLDVSLQAIQRVSHTDLTDPTDFFIRVQEFL